MKTFGSQEELIMNNEEMVNEENVQETVENNENNSNEELLEEYTTLKEDNSLQDQPESVEVKAEESFKVEEVEKPGSIEAIVEGLLYVVGEDGVKIEQIASAIEKSIEDTKVILENIQHKYSSELFGIELVAYGKVYKFITKKEVFPYAQTLFGESKPNTLSQSALETLAIIAYKQPITRVEIEELRGVGAEMMLRKLEARNLIKEAGRSDAPGRPILYEVTEEFMDSFKLYTLNELPDLPEYSNQEDQEKELFD